MGHGKSSSTLVPTGTGAALLHTETLTGLIDSSSTAAHPHGSGTAATPWIAVVVGVTVSVVVNTTVAAFAVVVAPARLWVVVTIGVAISVVVKATVAGFVIGLLAVDSAVGVATVVLASVVLISLVLVVIFALLVVVVVLAVTPFVVVDHVLQPQPSALAAWQSASL